MTLEDHQKWLNVYKKRLKEIEEEKSDIESERRKTLGCIEELQKGFPIGTEVKWTSYHGRDDFTELGVVTGKTKDGVYTIKQLYHSYTVTVDLKDLKKV